MQGGGIPILMFVHRLSTLFPLFLSPKTVVFTGYSLVGVMTFNFDMTIWHIAYISIARGFFYNYYYLILEEKNYIFEGMLIKIVI
jgi:hypothetical protein